MKNNLERNAYKYLVAAAAGVIMIGTIFYRVVEHFSFLNAYYFSVVSLLTVGYGDIVPTTPVGKIFTTFYLFTGVGIITTFVTFTLRRRADHMVERRQERKQKKTNREK